MLIVSFEEFQTTSENLLLIVNHLNESDKESQKITKNHHQFFIKKNKTIQWPSFNVLENRAGFERATKEEVSRRASKKSSQNQTMPQKKRTKIPKKSFSNSDESPQIQRTRKRTHETWISLQKSQPSFSNCNRGPTNLKKPPRIPKKSRKIPQMPSYRSKELEKRPTNISTIFQSLQLVSNRGPTNLKNPPKIQKKKNLSNVKPRVHKPKELEKEAHKTWIRLQKSQPSFSNCNRGPANLKNPPRIPKNPPKKNHWNDQKMSWLRIW